MFITCEDNVLHQEQKAVFDYLNLNRKLTYSGQELKCLV